MFDTIIKRGNYFPFVGICIIPHSRIRIFKKWVFVVKLFSSRHYVYCFRFEMDMFWSLWLGRQYKKLLTDSQTPITPLSRPKTGAVHLTRRGSRGGRGPLLHQKKRGERERKEKKKKRGKRKRDIKKLRCHNLFFCAYIGLHWPMGGRGLPPQ